MQFIGRIFQPVFLGFLVMSVVIKVEAAEWKTEPGLNLSTLYNDNARMASEERNAESSTAYTLSPWLRFSGSEQRLWDLSLSARGKMTRYQDIEDTDSDNVFFTFDSGRNTERTEWRLNASLERNSNFDTDFDTETPDADLLLDDHTQRDTKTVTPSFRWSMSETSLLGLSVSQTEVSYDEVTRFGFNDYTYDSAQIFSYWQLEAKHKLGFTGSYSEYERGDEKFTYDQSILSIDYTYEISEASNVSLSLGGRRIVSEGKDVVVGCEAISFQVQPVNGECPEAVNVGFFSYPVTPVIEDIKGEDDGAVVNIAYNFLTERSSHSLSTSRTVIPSSFGSAQEEFRGTYRYSLKATERFTVNLIVDGYRVETVSGANSLSDRRRIRLEPSIRYKLDRNWSLGASYRYLEQSLLESDIDSSSSAIFVNLYLFWPKLATTY